MSSSIPALYVDHPNFVFFIMKYAIHIIQLLAFLFVQHDA